MKKRTKIIAENKQSSDIEKPTSHGASDVSTANNTLQTSTADKADKLETVTAASDSSKVDVTKKDPASEKPANETQPKVAREAVASAKSETSTAAKSNAAAAKNGAKETVHTAQKSTAKAESKTSAKAPPKSTDSNNDDKPANTTGKLALVISIIALGLVGFQYYQAQQSASEESAAATASISNLKQELNANVQTAVKTANQVKTQADATLSKANAAIAEVSQNLQLLKAAEAQKSSDIDALQNRLTKSIQQVESSSVKQNSRKNWLLAEVEYLLRLANQRVLMENTPIGALALLKSADQILQQTDDVSIFSVRKALAADMAALAAVPHIDQEGMYLRIDALSAQINQLKLVPITDKKHLPKIIDDVATDAVKDAQAPESSFAKAWNKASAKLEKLVVISYRDSAIEPLLSPAAQAGLLQNLHILFEQTQLALLQRKQAPYQRSIEKAELIITTYFQVKDGTTQALLTGLKELKSEQISVDLPSIAGSLNTLKAYLKQGADVKSGAQG
ncbi:MAG: uroporphyrinogen-III C-methyltransferase [Oceanospirillaceae bacterium]